MGNTDKTGNRIAEENMNFFFDILSNGNSAAVLVDSLNEVKLPNELENRCNFPVLYYDLGKINVDDDERILSEIMASESNTVIFDNIDKIPEMQSDWLVKHLVKNALRKEESLPSLSSSLKRAVDFSQYHVGARCENWPPDYLEGVSLMAIPIEVRKDYNEEDDLNEV